jgi:serine/threonine-protein phosphatase 6 regulatory ankyrin repeat subunit B
MIAAEKGDLAVVQALLDAGPALLVNARDDHGFTALHASTEASSLPVVEALLEARADVNAASSVGATPLFYAASRKLPQIVDALLAAGADPNIANINGYTPLMMTNREIAERLLDSGADVNAQIDDGTTFLMAAGAGIPNSKDASLVTLLLERGADVAAVRRDGHNALMLAAHMDFVDIIELLLRAPSAPPGFIDTQTDNGITALIGASINGSTAAVEALIAAGANVHLTMHSGRTALHLAGNADVASLLWAAGARDTLDNDGANTLRSACARNKPDVVEFLLQRGLDVNALHLNRTPLMHTAMVGHLDVLRVLLAADPPAEVDRRSPDGYTALLLAALVNIPEVVKLLLAHGANDVAMLDGTTALMVAAASNHLEVLEELLLARPPTLINARAQDGRTALYFAVRMNFPRIIDALLAAGADPNIANNQELTPLMVARNADMAQRLLDGGADVNACSPARGTALTMAVADPDKDASLVALLLARGADVNKPRSDGCSALMLAVYKDIVKLLLAADPPAELDQQDNTGKTALYIAVQENHLIVAELLLKAGACPRTATNDGEIPLMRCKTPEFVKMLVDAAPDAVNHTCNTGRRALAYLTYLGLLEELFASSARHNIHIDVNHADVNGDTALHMAMLRRAGPAAVQLLLDKGADVFGVGSGATTVLMKPFSSIDGVPPVAEGAVTVADWTISECLRPVMEHMLSVSAADASTPVPVPLAMPAGVNRDMDEEESEEPVAKRRRRWFTE